jgi:hypothetical protein
MDGTGVLSIPADEEVKRGIPFGWMKNSEGGVYAPGEIYVG